MKRAPHPALRRLYALGAVPSRAQERLDRIAAPLMLVLRDLDDVKILSAPAFEPLLRGIDLSGIAREADQVKMRDRERTSNRAVRANKPRSRIASRDEAAAESGARIGSPPAAQDANSRIAEILRKFDSEHASAGNRQDLRTSSIPQQNGAAARTIGANEWPSVAPATETRYAHRNSVAEAPPKRTDSRSAASVGPERDGMAGSLKRAISRQDAAESIRRRASRVGDSAIADSQLSLNDADPGVVDSLERSNANSAETIALSQNLAEPESSAVVERRDSIAMLARALESLKIRRPRLRARGAEQREVAAASGANSTEQFRDDEAPRREVGEDAGGLRGLATRVSRRRGDGLVVERPPPQPSEDEFQHLLEAVLRREAGRSGIDLEEIER